MLVGTTRQRFYRMSIAQRKFEAKQYAASRGIMLMKVIGTRF